MYKDELLSMYEDKADRAEKECRQLWANNREMLDAVYWKDVVPYKYIVRMLRTKAGLIVCWGAVDCLATNLV